jgi:hypothetical protein
VYLVFAAYITAAMFIFVGFVRAFSANQNAVSFHLREFGERVGKMQQGSVRMCSGPHTFVKLS